MSRWRAYRQSSARLWDEHPWRWIVVVAMVAAVVFALVGVLTGNRWSNTLGVWACVMIGSVVGEWWRGQGRCAKRRDGDRQRSQ